MLVWSILPIGENVDKNTNAALLGGFVLMIVKTIADEWVLPVDVDKDSSDGVDVPVKGWQLQK